MWHVFMSYKQRDSEGIFFNKIEQAVKDISEDPEKWPIIHVQIRRRLIHRFPYALLYRTILTKCS